ncbi:glycerophosphodiester phosphodiesterase family protein [Sphingomonas sp. 2R-10]|uniref:glycerophosphodiester phosphodiesterase family protein n=1 Tax=Sphingomonas sp. 2R-10 TaxID=3045148 RepID=UPI000F7AA4D3|nr:glycerophosphodiester phosphodiesterase family protein [Sphingomonas sp. 2R-10]MDJ0278915.1 glycerophosphodiester phosphodiesterase family protein [Sphingomonas sp. 2R-10]
MAALAFASAAPAAPRGARASVGAMFAGRTTPVLVVAHRACHNPAPHHGMAEELPENSLAGIERCIAIGVDMAEVDVRRTRDGYMVLMHDDTVDRTTDGHGKVADLSLAQIRVLHLRANEGGADAPNTDLRVPTLEEALATSKGRIALNLDVQAGLYAETVAVVRGLKQEDGVVVKQAAGIGSPLLADTPPFDRVPFMPVLSGPDDLDAVAVRQSAGVRRPVAIELPRLPAASLPPIAEAAKRAGVRLWANSLWDGFIKGMGGDVDALRDPAAVWGRMGRAGITAIQTDEPEALIRYLATPGS